MKTAIENVLVKYRGNFHPVVNFNSSQEKLFRFDFTASNKELTEANITDTEKFSHYVTAQLKDNQAKFGIGGYNEDRVLYKRSSLFEPAGILKSPYQESNTIAEEAPVSSRSIHLGIDIWGPAGTAVFAPIDGMVHSFAFNDNFGDYGATIILSHELDATVFHTLYGHVSVSDIAQLHQGKRIGKGELIAHFGQPSENGWWPPHLHFQVIKDMDLKEGDYPGVSTMAESRRYLKNCPDPDLILNMMQYV